jgi:gas vesicle protein
LFFSVVRINFKKEKSMRKVSQTLIGLVREQVSQWRREMGWSREAVSDEIVQAHARIGADEATGIVFDPPARDLVSRMKVNADRIQRWLDDETKDSTLLPANLLPSVLAALPMERRLHLLNQILGPLGVEVRSAEEIGADETVSEMIRDVAKEGGEAVAALAGIRSESSQAELQAALKEVQEAREASTRAERGLRAMLARGLEKGKAAIGLRAVGN